MLPVLEKLSSILDYCGEIKTGATVEAHIHVNDHSCQGKHLTSPDSAGGSRLCYGARSFTACQLRDQDFLLDDNQLLIWSKHLLFPTLSHRFVLACG